MESERKTIRLPKKLLDAAEKKASELGFKDWSAWLRSLIERETGVSVEMKQGFSSISEAKLKRISKKGNQKRWEKKNTDDQSSNK